MDAHHGRAAAHALRAEADAVDAVFEQIFHFRGVRGFGIVRLDFGRISAFLDSSAAVSTLVATPMPTSSGGHALRP